MIVLEGADCVGKSTLAQRIFELMPELLGVAMMPRHFTKPPECFDYYWGYRECVTQHALIDRFHMSQVAYRKMDGGTCRLTPRRYALVDAAIEQAGGIVVVMYATDDLISERYQALAREGRREMYKEGQVIMVNRVYKQIIDDRHLMTRHGDYRFKVDVVLDNYTWDTDRQAEYVIRQWDMAQCELREIMTGAAQAGRVTL